MADDDVKELELYHKHFTDLFVYQARQRIDTIHFFMLAVAVAANAVVAAGASNFAKAVIAFVAGLVTIVFLRLDFRNAQIVEIDEKPLRYLQALTRKRMQVSQEWVTFQVAEDNARSLASYGLLVPAMYIFVLLSWFVTSAYFAYRWAEAINLHLAYPIVFACALLLLGIVATVYGKPKPSVAVTKEEAVAEEIDRDG